MYGGQTSQLLRRLYYTMRDTNLHSWNSICQEHEGEDNFQLYLWQLSMNSIEWWCGQFFMCT